MLDVAQKGRSVSHAMLGDEFVGKDDFREWLVRTGQALPAFWFDVAEGHLA